MTRDTAGSWGEDGEGHGWVWRQREDVRVLLDSDGDVVALTGPRGWWARLPGDGCAVGLEPDAEGEAAAVRALLKAGLRGPGVGR